MPTHKHSPWHAPIALAPLQGRTPELWHDYAREQRQRRHDERQYARSSAPDASTDTKQLMCAPHTAWQEPTRHSTAPREQHPEQLRARCSTCIYVSAGSEPVHLHSSQHRSCPSPIVPNMAHTFTQLSQEEQREQVGCAVASPVAFVRPASAAPCHCGMTSCWQDRCFRHRLEQVRVV